MGAGGGFAATGNASPGPHYRSTLPLTVIHCHSLGIYILTLLSLPPFSVKMTVSPRARQRPGAIEERRGLDGHRPRLFRPVISAQKDGRRREQAGRRRTREEDEEQEQEGRQQQAEDRSRRRRRRRGAEGARKVGGCLVNEVIKSESTQFLVPLRSI